MRKPSIGISPEGYPFIFLLAFSCLIFSILGYTIIAFILLGLTWIAMNFFRDPERVTPQIDDIAVSPADGKIVLIRLCADPFTQETRTCISIFMNLFNVHVNRSPVEGIVEKITYYPGKFINASLDKASDGNERCAYRIKADGGEFSVVQIAGLVARRIVCRVEAGDLLKRGERFGLIRFGSRLDVYLPDGYKPSVKVGELVFAGQSIIAESGN